MGTVPLVESILDARNLATASTFLFFLALFWIAFTTENQQRSATIIMVSDFCFHHIVFCEFIFLFQLVAYTNYTIR